MKTRISIIVLLVLAGTLLMPRAAVQATKPVDDLLITAQMQIINASEANGTFSVSSLLFSDSGTAYEVFTIDLEEGTIHGVKTLSGSQGTIVIKFQAQLTAEGAVGRFVVLSGDGAYATLHGVGTTFAAISETGGITAVYEGTAHLDP